MCNETIQTPNSVQELYAIESHQRNDSKHFFGERISDVIIDEKESTREKLVSLVNKRINVLECVKFHLKIMGCLPIDSVHWPSCFGCVHFQVIHISVIFAILLLNLVSTGLFHIYEWQTFIDFSEAVFWISRSVLSLTLYSMFIWYKSDFVKLFNDLDQMVNHRKHSFESLFVV